MYIIIIIMCIYSIMLFRLSSLRMLLRQGLAIRGHDKFDGNLEQLLHATKT